MFTKDALWDHVTGFVDLVPITNNGNSRYVWETGMHGVLTTQILEMTDVDSNESGWITENCSLLEGKIKVWRA